MYKIILPIIVLIGAVFLGKYLVETGPESKKKPFVERVPVVEVIKLKPQSYTVIVTTSGIVTAGTQTSLVAEVSGRVLSLSDIFQVGNYFEKNEILLSIDQDNYKNAIAITNSDVIANRAQLSQIIEEEKSSQRSYLLAKKNLSLGKKEVTRLRALLKKKVIARSILEIEQQKTNQLQQKLEDLQGRLNTYKSRKQAIKARISAAQAKQKQESLNLSRTTIKAPYAGRILEKNVDIGQFVSKGTTLGKIYATDYVEVNLPLSLNRYELLDLPEAFKNKSIDKSLYPEVVFRNPRSLQKHEWKGRIVRTSAALDPSSRQISVIARIYNPFDAKEGVHAPLRVGQYLQSEIKGMTFEHVYVLPTSAVHQNKEIMILEGGKIQIVPIITLWNTQNETVVRVDEAQFKHDSNIQGKLLVTTKLGQASNGMKVMTVAESIEKEKREKQEKKDKTREEKRNTKQDLKALDKPSNKEHKL